MSRMIRRTWTIRRTRIAIWTVTIGCLVIASSFSTVPWMKTVGENVLIPLGFWTGIAFIVYYTVLAPWWHTPMGRMIVSFDFAFVLITAGDTLRHEFGISFSDSTAIRILFAGLLIAPAVIISRTLLLGALHGWKPSLPWRHPADSVLNPIEGVTWPGTKAGAEAAPTAEQG